MTTFLNEGRDVQGYNVNAPIQSKLIYTATMSASTHETITVPSSYARWIAFFRYKDATDFWVAINGTAAVPAGATFATSTSELNPPAYELLAADVIDVITASGTADISVSLYAIS